MDSNSLLYWSLDLTALNRQIGTEADHSRTVTGARIASTAWHHQNWNRRPAPDSLVDIRSEVATGARMLALLLRERQTALAVTVDPTLPSHVLANPGTVEEMFLAVAQHLRGIAVDSRPDFAELHCVGIDGDVTLRLVVSDTALSIPSAPRQEVETKPSSGLPVRTYTNGYQTDFIVERRVFSVGDPACAEVPPLPSSCFRVALMLRHPKGRRAAQEMLRDLHVQWMDLPTQADATIWCETFGVSGTIPVVLIADALGLEDLKLALQGLRLVNAGPSAHAVLCQFPFPDSPPFLPEPGITITHLGQALIIPELRDVLCGLGTLLQTERTERAELAVQPISNEEALEPVSFSTPKPATLMVLENNEHYQTAITERLGAYGWRARTQRMEVRSLMNHCFDETDIIGIDLDSPLERIGDIVLHLSRSCGSLHMPRFVGFTSRPISHVEVLKQSIGAIATLSKPPSHASMLELADLVNRLPEATKRIGDKAA